MFGQVRERVSKLEVDRRQAHHARARDVRDLHPRRLEREDARLRAVGVGGEVDQNVEIVGGDPLGGPALGLMSDHLEAVRKAPVAFGPFVCDRGQRVEEKLEAIAVVMLKRRPHHLAHDMVAQITGQITDADAAGPPLL